MSKCFNRVVLLICMILAISSKSSAQSWEHAGWGGGGCYWAAAFDPHKDGVIYLGGDVAGIYRSDDHGLHWRMINNGLVNYGVYSIAVDVKTPGTVYAGTHGGLCKSTDGGETWQFIANTGKKELRITAERNKSVRAIAVDPTDSRIVYAASPAGKVYKSEDGAATWRPVYQLEKEGTVYSVAVSRKNPALVLAATETAGVIMSEDAGQSWTPLQTPAKANSVAIAQTDENVMYATCATDGVWKSADRGKTWAKSSDGMDDAATYIEVAVSPADASKVYVIGKVREYTGRFYASNDGGATWTLSTAHTPDHANNPTRLESAPKGQPARMSRLSNIAINPFNPDEIYIAANWRSLWSNDAGKTWAERNDGADITCTTDIRFHRSRVYVSAMDEGTFVSEDNGANWKQLWPQKPNAGKDATLCGHYWRLAIVDNNGVDRILSTCSPWNAKTPNRMVISDNGGKTFKEYVDGLPNFRPTGNTMWGTSFARALAVDPNNPKVVYLGMDGDPAAGNEGGGAFKSEDGGLTWKRLPAQPGSRRMFYGLAVDPTDSKRLYWGAAVSNGGLYRSDDGGASWNKTPLKETAVFNLLVTTDGTVYAPGQNLWRSTDHGRTWTKLTAFDGPRTIVGLEVDPRDSKTIWISALRWGEVADGDVYKTTDGGATWQVITGDLGYRKPILLRFNPATNELWAGGNGLFKIKQ